jgi:hypothetical protein
MSVSIVHALVLNKYYHFTSHSSGGRRTCPQRAHDTQGFARLCEQPAQTHPVRRRFKYRIQFRKLTPFFCSSVPVRRIYVIQQMEIEKTSGGEGSRQNRTFH